MSSSTWAIALRLAASASLLTGAICQFIQATDPRPPLSYFTVNSALLAASAMLAMLAFPSSKLINRIRGTAVVAVVISGLVFASIIAPGTNGGSWFAPHDDPFSRAATLLMHGVGPVLIIFDYLLNPIHTVQPKVEAFRWLSWPAGYFAAVAPLAALGFLEFPYEFLNPEIVGPIASVLAFMVVGLSYWATSTALIAVGNKLHLRRHDSVSHVSAGD